MTENDSTDGRITKRSRLFKQWKAMISHRATNSKPMRTGKLLGTLAQCPAHAAHLRAPKGYKHETEWYQVMQSISSTLDNYEIQPHIVHIAICSNV